MFGQRQHAHLVEPFQAMDAMDNHGAKAIDVMGQNNTLIRDQLTRASRRDSRWGRSGPTSR
jgi:hypothetical protein